MDSDEHNNYDSTRKKPCVKHSRHLVSSRDIGWFSNALFMVSAWIVHFIYSTATAIIPDKHKRRGNEIMNSIMEEETEITVDGEDDVITDLHMDVSSTVRVIMAVIDSIIFIAAIAIVVSATYMAFVYL